MVNILISLCTNSIICIISGIISSLIFLLIMGMKFCFSYACFFLLLLLLDAKHGKFYLFTGAGCFYTHLYSVELCSRT